MKEKDSNKLPTLNFKIYTASENYEGLKHFLEIYEKYNESEKMQITGNFSSTPFDGSKLVDNSSNYTLFSGDNTAKTSGTTGIKSMNINTLVKFSNKYNVKKIKNIIVSGTPSANSSVDWTNLTNVIFEENMSNLTIKNKTDLKGIVYFKDLPYNNSNNNTVNGALKLNKMSDTIRVTGDGSGQESFVLDISSISNFFNSYTGGVLVHGSGIINAVYFNSDQQTKEGKDLYVKIVDESGGIINNVYFGGIRADGKYRGLPGVQTSDEARTLKEFEYYGNKGVYEKGGTVALNNKNINFINPDTNEIVSRRFV